MQFIDFKKEHFTSNDEKKSYFLEISKEEVGYGEITAKEKLEDDMLAETEYMLEDDFDKVKIIVSKPIEIRVYF